MVNKTDNWSPEWNSSKNPSKQRKYRDNAPLHVKDNLISANLDKELRDELGTRNINLRTGDRVKVMRGDRKGAEGIVNNIDRSDLKVYVRGINNTRQDGSTNQKAFDPSNVQITALNIEDTGRLDKYDVDDFESIKVEEEEVEEALSEDEEGEMMQRMKDEDKDEEEIEEVEDIDEELEPEEEETEEETDKDSSESESYDKVVSNNIGDVKEEVESMEEPDYDALIEAEKSNKDRKTMVEWLENQKE